MPPRLPLAQAAWCCRTSTALPSAAPSLISLFAALSVQTQTRSASILGSLSDNPGAYNKRIRKGRGPSSGYGKTAGRGTKGQNAHGKVKPWFQGGQTPLIFSHGKKGFVNHLADEMSVFNLDKLQEFINNGRLDPTKPITPKELIRSGIIGRSIRDGIKLLAKGSEKLKTPVDIMVSRASATAIKAIEDAGGKIVTRYYTKDSLRRLAKGESINTDKPLPVGAEHVESILEEARMTEKHFYRLPDPTSRWDIEYYRDPAHRGYLSHTVQPGQSPSLYFKVPGEKPVTVKKAKIKTAAELDPQLF
ncbi:ribosomal protein L18e/L15P [Immersiella caudata]|uniref:Ribosomal protein L18e/L15P n=1 Tax=Immersiella caudata TaxID=314043 RepID=A0AA39WYN3_9PEZI|nr:ribosomal protein L18e/L15P [Immersiella caudata]